MITKSTVLILGAGASMPYGFPSGRQLVENIRDTEIAEGNLAPSGFTSVELKGFRDELREADPSSVDGFLEHRKDLIPIGKVAIAYALIKYEIPDRLYPDENAFKHNDKLDKAEQWYRHLAEKLVTDIDSFHKNKLAVVTFNYDRSLDHYVFQSLLRRWGVQPVKVVEALRNLPIIHVHGQLGPLPWQCEQGDPCRPFEGGVSGESVKTAAAGIKIISDPDLENSAEFQEARRYAKGAERIYVLGFGYHTDNMRRLELPLEGHEFYDHNRRILGTCHGFSDVERQSLQERFRGIDFQVQSQRILDTLRNDRRFVLDV